MTTKSADIKVQSSEVLTRLYEVFDELGMIHRYSTVLGEFDVKVGEEWLTFYVDPDVLKEEREDQAWAEDAYAVADSYWRE